MRTKSKSIFKHIEYSQGGVYIYKSESIALGTGTIWEYGLNTGKRCVQKENTGMLCRNMGQEQEKDKNRNWNWD